jgi:hypothetical protein
LEVFGSETLSKLMERQMSPEERQLLVGLFDRIRQNANNPRDPEAERFIADQVRAQPYAPYLLAQTVIVQDQALRAANDRLQQLEQHVRELEGQGGQQSSGGFLGSLGSLFGGGADRGPPPSSVPPSRWGSGPQGGTPGYGQGGYGQQQGYGQPGGYGQPQSGPWSGGAPYQQGGGGGFLKGALGAAAGVAGGVLLADSIRGLFHGAGNPFGIGSGVGGGAGLGGSGGGDTIVNNYGDDADAQQAGDFGPDVGPDDSGDVLDAGSSDDLGGGDDSYNV